MNMQGRIAFIPLEGREHLSRLYPAKETPSCAGIDFFSPEDVKLQPLERKAIPTGFEVLMPEGMYGQITDCSGMALQKGCHVLGGVIDSDYQGEMFILLVNLSQKEVKISKYDKLAQMLIHQQSYVTPMVMTRFLRQSLSIQSQRKSKGFGYNSTADLHLQAYEPCEADGKPLDLRRPGAAARSGAAAHPGTSTDPRGEPAPRNNGSELRLMGDYTN
jgi:dUTP pyrophosphatase